MKAIINKDLELLNDVHKRRNEWMEELQKIGISTRPATHAVHMLHYYREKYNAKPEQYPASQAANDCSISFPLFNGMQDSEQQYVIDAVRGRRT